MASTRWSNRRTALRASRLQADLDHFVAREGRRGRRDGFRPTGFAGDEAHFDGANYLLGVARPMRAAAWASSRASMR